MNNQIQVQDMNDRRTKIEIFFDELLAENVPKSSHNETVEIRASDSDLPRKNADDDKLIIENKAEVACTTQECHFLHYN